MDNKVFGTLAFNMGALLLGALPATAILMALQFNSTGLQAVLLDAAGVFVTGIVPLWFGGFVHQYVLVKLPKEWPVARRLIVGRLTSPLVAVALVPMLGYLLDFPMPILAGFLVYLLLMRTPPAGAGMSQA